MDTSKLPKLTQATAYTYYMGYVEQVLEDLSKDIPVTFDSEAFADFSQDMHEKLSALGIFGECVRRVRSPVKFRALINLTLYRHSQNWLRGYRRGQAHFIPEDPHNTRLVSGTTREDVEEFHHAHKLAREFAEAFPTEAKMFMAKEGGPGGGAEWFYWPEAKRLPIVEFFCRRGVSKKTLRSRL